MKRYEIVTRARILRAHLDRDWPEVRPRRPEPIFEFDSNEVAKFVARAKWQLVHMPRGLSESAELLGEIRGIFVGAGYYEMKELEGRSNAPNETQTDRLAESVP
jgi:hypothetical protein